MKDLLKIIFKSEKEFLVRYGLLPNRLSNIRRTLLNNEVIRNATYLNILEVINAKEKDIEEGKRAIEEMREIIKDKLWI